MFQILTYLSSWTDSFLLHLKLQRQKRWRWCRWAEPPTDELVIDSKMLWFKRAQTIIPPPLCWTVGLWCLCWFPPSRFCPSRFRFRCSLMDFSALKSFFLQIWKMLSIFIFGLYPKLWALDVFLLTNFLHFIIQDAPELLIYELPLFQFNQHIIKTIQIWRRLQPLYYNCSTALFSTLICNNIGNSFMRLQHVW